MTTTNPPQESLAEELEREIFTPVDELISEPAEATDADLEELWKEVAPERKLRKPKSRFDASLRDALDAAAKKMQEVYSDPANWKRIRGVMLVDKTSQTILGNYSEYVNTKVEMAAGVSRPRKWLLESQPIVIEAREEIEGFLGVERERQIRGVSWDNEKVIRSHILFDGIFCEAPEVELKVCLQLHSIVRVELVAETQFATSSGGFILKLPTGVDIWPAVSVDTKAAIRRAAL